MKLKEALAELRRLEDRVHSAEAYLGDPECRGGDRRAAMRHLRKCQQERQEFLASLNPNISTTGDAGMLAGASA